MGVSTLNRIISSDSATLDYSQLYTSSCMYVLVHCTPSRAVGNESFEEEELKVILMDYRRESRQPRDMVNGNETSRFYSRLSLRAVE